MTCRWKSGERNLERRVFESSRRRDAFASTRDARATRITLRRARSRQQFDPVKPVLRAGRGRHGKCGRVPGRGVDRHGRADEFTALRPFLDFSEEESGPSYATVAAQLGGTTGAARVAVHRLRKSYREALFAEIAETLDDPSPEAIKEEIQALFAALG